MSKPKLPRYTEPGRYPYHFVCTRIEPYHPEFLERARKSEGTGVPWIKQGATHGCYCSAWKQLDDGTFMHWRDGKWQTPLRGAVKSKPIPEHE